MEPCAGGLESTRGLRLGAAAEVGEERKGSSTGWGSDVVVDCMDSRRARALQQDVTQASSVLG